MEFVPESPQFSLIPVGLKVVTWKKGEMYFKAVVLNFKGFLLTVSLCRGQARVVM